MNRKSNKPRGLNRDAIRKMYNDGYCLSSIARKFKCHQHTIMHHIYDLVIPMKNYSRAGILSDNQIVSIRNKFIYGGMSGPTLAKEYNVSQSTILNVIHGIYYRYVPGEILLKDGTIVTIVKGMETNIPIKIKGRRKGGPKTGDKKRTYGCLLPLAEKYGVSRSTICKWLNKGKIRESKYKKYQKEY